MLFYFIVKLIIFPHAVADVGVKNAHYPAGIAAVYVGSKSQAYLYYVAEIDSSYHLYRPTSGQR
jgi:hypothetical protein